MNYDPNPQFHIAIIPREKHTISRKNVSDNALKILHRLNRAGYEAYIVGGGVRDLLLGKKPKDFDIATNAKPEQICKLFHNCRLVGRRFQLVHVIFGSEIIEVATFRGYHKSSATNLTTLKYSKNSMLLQDNIFGSIEEDAYRRDFTINSLYYSISNYTVLDHVGGIQDLKEGLIRFVDNPETRYREDPVRMLRAVRFAAKLNMHISPETAKPISHLAILISNISPARLFEEILKLLQAGFGYKTYKLLRKYKLFQALFPIITRNFTKSNNSPMEKMIIKVLKNTDKRIHNNMRVNPAFLFAAMFWYPLIEEEWNITITKKINENNFILAANDVLNKICRSLAIPKRIASMIRDIWRLQLHMLRFQGKNRAWNLKDHPKFKAAYYLLTLRAEIEKSSDLQNLVNWWDEFQISQSLKKKDNK